MRIAVQVVLGEVGSQCAELLFHPGEMGHEPNSGLHHTVNQCIIDVDLDLRAIMLSNTLLSVPLDPQPEMTCGTLTAVATQPCQLSFPTSPLPAQPCYLTLPAQPCYLSPASSVKSAGRSALPHFAMLRAAG